MTDTPTDPRREGDLDAAVRGMLSEQAPPMVPSDLRRRILQSTAQTPQRRGLVDLAAFGPTGRRLVASATRAAVVMLVAVGVYGLYTVGGRLLPGDPSPSPAPTPSSAPSADPSPRDLRFVSERYGYSLELPDDTWQVLSVPGQWRPGTWLYPTADGVDRIVRTSAEGEGDTSAVRPPLFYLSSQPLADDLTFDQWAADQDALFATAERSCALAPDEGDALLGAALGALPGAEASRVVSRRCTDGLGQTPANEWGRVEVDLLHGGRAFVFRLEECPQAIRYFGFPCGPADPFPAAELADWLERFAFTR